MNKIIFSIVSSLAICVFHLYAGSGLIAFDLANAEDLKAPVSVIYHVKGIVKGLPGNGLGPNEILIKHAALPDYKDIQGKVVGMGSMTMPFYTSSKVQLGDIAVGDLIEFELEASWQPTFSEKITSLKKIDQH